MLLGHIEPVWSVAFSPNSEYLVSGSKDYSIGIWKIPNGELIKRIKGHNDQVRCVIFSPNGKSFASASLDNTISLWSID